jgi:uncharacterized membrane protein YebE (DUF533 family)
MPRLIYILTSSALLPQFVLLEGCAPGSQANKEAGKGAAVGTVGGAVAGGLSSILFGGSVARGLATGAAIGAATGAATGAVSGSMADNEAKQAAAPQNSPAPGTVDLGDLKEKLGPKNIAAATALARCRHADAVAAATEACSTLDGVIKLQKIREDNGLPPLCSST